MRIDVSLSDIRLGIRRSHCDCPIALAIRRATGNHGVFVAYNGVQIGDGMTYLPIEATQFIVAFDNSENVQPFSFDLTEE